MPHQKGRGFPAVAVVGFAGLQDLSPIQLGLNLHYNLTHLGIGVLSILAGFAIPRPTLTH